MAALGTWIAGRYSGSYTPSGGSATDAGLVEKGYTITVAHAREVIKDTDAFADIEIDGVHRGMNVYCGFKCKEYKAGPLALALSYNAAQFNPTGANSLTPGVIGRLSSGVAGSLTLSSTTGTPAAVSPASLVINYADIMEGFNVEWLYGPEHRQTPLRFRALLYSNLGTPTFLTTT